MCAEEGSWIQWTRDFKDEAARKRMRITDVVKEDILRVGDRVGWRQGIHCGDPNREHPKEEL